MSRIEWTDVTWNPVRGCSRVSEGCRNCYAERIAVRFSGPGKPYEGFADVPAGRRHSETGTATCGVRGHWTGRVELIPDKLDEPLHWKKPRRVFVNSMSDLFHEALPDEAVGRVWLRMLEAHQHTFQVLTKRPERMRGLVSRLVAEGERKGLVPADNVWLGVSCEDQATADERIPLLLQTPAAVRFISLEPMLGPVDLRFLQPGDPPTEIDALAGTHGVLRPHGGRCTRLDWVIVGGESGPGARPCDVVWIRSVVQQCREAGVACFVKQLGARPISSSPDDKRMCGDAMLPNGFRITGLGSKGQAFEEWPEDFRMREFPK